MKIAFTQGEVENIVDPLISQFNVTQITTDNGLPQDHTSHIYKDKNGFIWILTSRGFFSYDGDKFKEVDIFSNKKVNKERPISHYNKEGEVIVTYEIPSSSKGEVLFLLKNLTTGIEKILNNRTRLSFQGKLTKSNKATKYLRNLYGVDTIAFTVTDKAIHLHKFTPSKDTLERFQFSFDTRLEPQEYNSFAICSNSLFVFRGSKKTSGIKAISYTSTSDLGLLEKVWEIEGDELINSKGDYVNLEKCYFLNYQSTLKYLYYVVENTLYRIEKQSKKLISKRLVSDISFITEKAEIFSIYSDPDATTILITTRGEGVYQLKKQHFQNPFPKDDIYAHLEMSPNKFLIGMLEKHSCAIRDINDKDELNSSKTANIFTIIKDKTSKIGLLSQSSGFFYIDIPSQQRVKQLEYIDSKELLMVRNDNAIGMRRDSSIVFYKDGEFNTVLDSDDYTSEYAMVEDKEGFIWTGGEGLHLIDPKTKTLKYILDPSHTVRTIYITKNNTILVGTYGQGIYRYKNGRITKLPLDNQSYLKFAHCFMEDLLGYFWVTTNKGLFKVDGEVLENYKEGQADPIYYYYEKTDGFAGNEFNGGCTPCGVKMHNGHFSFPSMKGLVQFDPLAVPMEFPKSRIYIRDVKLSSVDTTFAANTEFFPDFKNFTFRLTVPYFGKKENLQLSYRIKGFEDKWMTIERNEKIEITTLSPGAYVLEARYPNSKTSNSFEYLKIPFTVAPFYYEMLWFKLLVFFGISGILYLLYRFRTQKIITSKLQLEKEVALKTRSLELSLKTIERNNESLVKDNLLKHKLISIATHNISGPLNFMSKVSKRLSNDFYKYPDSEVKQQLDLIKDTSYEVFQIQEDILTWIKYQREEIQPKREEIRLKELVEKIIRPYQSMINEKEITLSNNVVDTIIQNDTQFITLILQNLIHNALKFTHRGGQIIIGAENQKQDFVLYVQDTGVGMTNERKEQVINGIILHSHHGTAEESGQGLGLSIVKELLPKIDGHLAIESELGKGSIFKIILKSGLT